jgi:hypothetical protein
VQLSALPSRVFDDGLQKAALLMPALLSKQGRRVAGELHQIEDCDCGRWRVRLDLFELVRYAIDREASTWAQISI